jgi:hypothetical protein
MDEIRPIYSFIGYFFSEKNFKGLLDYFFSFLKKNYSDSSRIFGL